MEAKRIEMEGEMRKMDGKERGNRWVNNYGDEKKTVMRSKVKRLTRGVGIEEEVGREIMELLWEWEVILV